MPKELEGIRYTTSEIDASPPKLVSQSFTHWNLSTIGPTNNTFHESYHPNYEIDMFIAELAESFPELVTVIKLGHSAEARELFGLKLSRNAGGKGRMGFVINGAQHAREVRTTAGLLFVLSQPFELCSGLQLPRLSTSRMPL